MRIQIAYAALLSAKANAFYSPSSLLSRRAALFATTSTTSDNMSTEVAKVSVKISDSIVYYPITILSNTISSLDVQMLYYQYIIWPTYHHPSNTI